MRAWDNVSYVDRAVCAAVILVCISIIYFFFKHTVFGLYIISIHFITLMRLTAKQIKISGCVKYSKIPKLNAIVAVISRILNLLEPIHRVK